MLFSTGAWIIYHRDSYIVVIAIFDDELSARRMVDDCPDMYRVGFVPFGARIDLALDAWDKARAQEQHDQ